MNVVCESCHAKYRIPDERVAGKKVKIRCRKCGESMTVRGMASEVGQTSAPSSVAPSAAVVAAKSSAAPAAAAKRAPSSTLQAPRPAGSSAVPTPAQAYSIRPPVVAEQSVSESAPPEHEWYASIDGDQHGPMDEETLIQWLVTYPTAWDAHVWRDGFGDWLPARYLDNLVDGATALIGPDAVNAALRESARAAAEDEKPEPALFAVPDASDVAYEAPPIPAVAATSVPEHSTLIGARNESSVLFSVSNMRSAASTGSSPSLPSASSSPSLRAVSSAPAPAPASSPSYPPLPGHATGEGSGIVDIRALAAMARTHSSVPSQSDSSDAEEAESLLTVGLNLPPLDSLAPTQLSPAVTKRKSAILPAAIVGGASLVAAALVLVAIITRTTPETLEQEAPVAVAASNAAPTPMAAVAAPSPQEASAQAPASSSAVASAAEPQTSAAPSPTSRSAKWRRKSKGGNHSGNSASSSAEVPPAATQDKDSDGKDEPEAEGVGLDDALMASASDKAATSKPAPESGEAPSVEDLMAGPKATSTPEAVSAPVPKEPQKSRSIDDLLDTAVAQSSGSKAPAKAAKAPAAASPASSSLPAQPSREQVLTAMRGVTPAIQRCASQNGAVGSMAKVKFIISGPTATVTSSDVSGVGGAAAACIATAAKRAQFPRFQKPVFTVTYPFRL